MNEPILTPFLGSQDITVYQGDCIDVMARMPEASVDTIITDPPYGLEFMGRDWDGFGTPLGFQTWTERWAREALRILKPGGHLLAFGGTRTYHRLGAGIEDAGFEIRDCLAWLYGSGFPKSLDVSKAIDKAAGAEREVVDVMRSPYKVDKAETDRRAYGKFDREKDDRGYLLNPVTAPATPDAEKWNGWGTALKPAFEPIVLARKPLIGTVAANVLEHGTGALNIDGCRIAYASGDDKDRALAGDAFKRKDTSDRGWSRPWMNDPERVAQINREAKERAQAGRWPANVTLDEEAAAMLDEQSGERPGSASQRRLSPAKPGMFGVGHGSDTKPIHVGYDDKGGASRFFYCAKASKKDRNTNGADNHHPTVKPTALMRWLIRLATPPGGIILDPFGGSGSTGVAARAEGVRAILIEREDEYLNIIRQRLDEGPLFGNLD